MGKIVSKFMFSKMTETQKHYIKQCNCKWAINIFCTISKRSYKSLTLFAESYIRNTNLNIRAQFIPSINSKQQKRVTEKFSPAKQSFKTTRVTMWPLKGRNNEPRGNLAEVIYINRTLSLTTFHSLKIQVLKLLKQFLF